MHKDDVIVLTHHAKGILQIHLNRPAHLNALSRMLLQSLQQTLNAVRQDKKIKAILLSGDGKAFCAGADINELASLNGAEGLEFARFGQQVFNLLESLGKPSLAAVQGYALGGGCELAMAATCRITTNNAQWGQPEIKLGVIPGFGGTQRLARLIGRGRALDLCLSGKRISAQQAYEWGLVNELVAPEDLLTRAMAILNEWVQFSPIAMEGILSAIQHGCEMSLNDGLAFEASHFALCCASADKREGVAAFLEKRIPVFTGE